MVGAWLLSFPKTQMGSRRRWSDEVGEGAFSPDFHAASELIGKRWTGAIVRSLFHEKPDFAKLATPSRD